MVCLPCACGGPGIVNIDSCCQFSAVDFLGVEQPFGAEPLAKARAGDIFCLQCDLAAGEVKLSVCTPSEGSAARFVHTFSVPPASSAAEYVVGCTLANDHQVPLVGDRLI